MNARSYKTILTAVLAISVGILAPERLSAQTCQPFLLGMAPLAKIHYISVPNFEGDRLVVGEWNPALGEIWWDMPGASFPKQTYCGLREIAPGFFAEAYVPDFSFDFSNFGVSLLDPLTERFDFAGGQFSMDAFPGNRIPPNRDLGVWRISSAPLVFSASQSVPIVLSLRGSNDSFYTSELTLTNRGAVDHVLTFKYTAAFGEGTGSVTDTLRAGQQRIVPDALAYLRLLGLPIATSARNGGTLIVKASGLASPADIAVTVRTTTTAVEGRAGLAYSGNTTWGTDLGGLPGDSDPRYVCGLRQNAADRSHVAVMHAGNSEDGEIRLQLTVTSGNAPFGSRTLPEIVLAPGGFHQIDEVLSSNGLSLSNGYVRVQRVSGRAPYFAYGVINDQVNSDGSFIPPLLPTRGFPELRLTIPVMVETEVYRSELILANTSGRQQRVDLSFVAEGIQTSGHRANLSIDLAAGQQLFLPDFVQYLRDRGIPGIEPRGTNYVGALIATVLAKDRDGNDGRGVFIGARTSTPSKDGGQFGVFYPGFPLERDRMATTSAWVYGLQQNSETRTNLALVCGGLASGDPNTFRIELFDGATGNRVNSLEGITVASQGWVQFGSILAQYAPGTSSGYAHVTRTAGKNPFIAYAIVNDGPQPGQRTGDGAFVSMQLDVPYAAASSTLGPWDY